MIESQPNFYTKINPGRSNSTIDSGIGRTKNKLINNLGTDHRTLTCANVPAQDNNTGTSSQSTIANVKRRLSQPATDRMMLVAEKNRAEYQSNKQKIGTKNGLEYY